MTAASDELSEGGRRERERGRVEGRGARREEREGEREDEYEMYLWRAYEPRP